MVSLTQELKDWVKTCIKSSVIPVCQSIQGAAKPDNGAVLLWEAQVQVGLQAE